MSNESVGSVIGRLIIGTGRSIVGLTSDVMFALMTILLVLLMMAFSGLFGGLLVVILGAGNLISGPVNGIIELLIQWSLTSLLLLPAFMGGIGMRFLIYPEEMGDDIVDFFGLNCDKFTSRLLLLLPPGLMLIWYREGALNPEVLGRPGTLFLGFVLLSTLYRSLVYAIATGQKYSPGSYSYELPASLKIYLDAVSIIGFGFLFGAFEYVFLQRFLPGIASSLYAIPRPIFILGSGSFSVLAILILLSASLLVAPTGYWVVSNRDSLMRTFWSGVMALEPVARRTYSVIQTTGTIVIGVAGLALTHLWRMVNYLLLIPPEE